MEVFIVLLALVLFLVVFVAPIIALVRSAQARRLAEENEDHTRQVTTRLYALERDVQKLETALATLKPGQEATAEICGRVPAAPPEPQAAAQPAEKVELAPPATLLPAKIPVTQASQLPLSPIKEEPRTVPPRAEPAPPRPPMSAARADSQAPLPAPTGPGRQPPVATPEGGAFSAGRLEETLGTNWLNKLGVVILVIGIALFIGYKLRTLGPGGKDLVGYLVAAAMLGAGVYFERRERWRILARAGMGGGWALAFFVTYAMRHVDAARVLESNAADLVLLLLVSAGMVGHTLKYRSQTVTGLAFLLAFLTVNANRGALPGLYANAVLVVALAVIAVWLEWYELEIFGILAVFLTHYYWLRPIVEPLPRPHGEFPGYALSSALLAFYWTVFLVSYVVRKVKGTLDESVSTVAAILNAGLFVWLMGYQSAHPEKAFQFFLIVGAVEFVVGQLPITRRRRSAFILLTLIGTGLLVAAFPYKFSHQSLSIFWLLEAETLFLAGVLLEEKVFRCTGMAVAFLTAGQILFADTRQVLDLREAAHADVPLPHLAILYFAAALVFYFNAHNIPRRRPAMVEQALEVGALRATSYVAGLLAMLGVWVICSEQWTAVGWAAMALLLNYLGARWKARELSYAAYGVAMLAILRGLFVNLAVAPYWHSLSLRMVTVSLVAALLYVSSRWAGSSEALTETLSRRLPSAFTWSASALAAIIFWYELRPISVALGWTLFGLVLFEIGMGWKSGQLRGQSYVAFLASFARIFFVNLNAPRMPGLLSPRVFTILPLALVFYYAYERLERGRDDFLASDRKFKAPAFLSLLATLTLAAIVRFELNADWVVVGWASLVLVLFALAWRTERRVFLHHGLLLSFVVLFRAIEHNFYERSYFPAAFWSWYSRPLCVGATIALLYVALAFAFQLRHKAKPAGDDRGKLARVLAFPDRRPEQVVFFIATFLLTVLLAFEMRKGMVTVAWGVEAVAVFLFALAAGERTFRLTGLGLLLLCAGKIGLFDFWDMTTPDKILTAIVIGSALTGVSFLYTRYREALRQYL